ncbi:hypothetical protein MESS4_520062 [Mesorhizobium sp. STM 4661]|nr:hypothetical protein MESS4_520062 [Mesorhizobium sp. STM 4661]
MSLNHYTEAIFRVDNSACVFPSLNGCQNSFFNNTLYVTTVNLHTELEHFHSIYSS